MLWWPLFFISLLSADDLTVERYCFSSVPQMERAYVLFNGISVPSDKALKEGNCFVVSARPHRRELIQKYLLSQNPDMSVTFSSEAIRKDPCELKVEKIKVSAGEASNIEISKNGSIETSESSGSASEVFQITTLKEFELSLYQDKISGECRYISPQHYEITLTVQKEAKQYIPPVPPGTIVVVSTPPPDQQTSILKTQLQLQRGSRIEIGNIVQDMKDKDRSLDASPKIEVSGKEKSVQEKVFLSIN